MFSNNPTMKKQLHSSLQGALHDIDSPGESAARAAAGFPAAPLPAASNHLFQLASTAAALANPLVPSIGDAGILNHARAALLKQQLLAVEERQRQLVAEERNKLLLQQDRYLALLNASKAPTVTPQRSLALDMLLAAQAQQHQAAAVNSMVAAASSQTPSLQTALLQQYAQPKPTPNALEALGSNLRKKNDPYIDVSPLPDPDPTDSTIRRTRGGVSTPFPEKLHQMLVDAEKEGKQDVISFYSHGRAFAVHDPKRFVEEIMPKYFKQSKWNSFARQLNLYGFIRITSGPDAGGYYHELFLQGRPNLAFHMRRVGVPQGADRRKMKTKQESPDPDFYNMKPISK